MEMVKFDTRPLATIAWEMYMFLPSLRNVLIPTTYEIFGNTLYIIFQTSYVSEVDVLLDEKNLGWPLMSKV